VCHGMCASATTHCNTLQHTATHCNTLQHETKKIVSTCMPWYVCHCNNTATHCNTHCNTLQHSAITPQHTATQCSACNTLHNEKERIVSTHVPWYVCHCNNTTTLCNTMQHTATSLQQHCNIYNTLQHTATYRNMRRGGSYRHVPQYVCHCNNTMAHRNILQHTTAYCNVQHTAD